MKSSISPEDFSQLVLLMSQADQILAKNVKKQRIPWSDAEVQCFDHLIKERGPGNWKKLANLLYKRTGILRTEQQVCQRWMRVQQPDLRKGRWEEEEELILKNCMSKGVTLKEIHELLPNRSLLQISNKMKKIL